MHAFPEWFMVLMTLVLHPAFLIAAPIMLIAVVVLIARAARNRLKEKRNG